jgi:O-methyltransferase domain
MGPFEYLEHHPEAGRVFNEAMAGLTRQRAAAVVAAYDFSGLRKIVNVGGGQGEFLIVLLKAHPTVTGVLVDLPAAINGAAGHRVGFSGSVPSPRLPLLRWSCGRTGSLRPVRGVTVSLAGRDTLKFN